MIALVVSEKKELKASSISQFAIVGELLLSILGVDCFMKNQLSFTLASLGLL
jgi:hypothetical protein